MQKLPKIGLPIILLAFVLIILSLNLLLILVMERQVYYLKPLEGVLSLIKPHYRRVSLLLLGTKFIFTM